METLSRVKKYEDLRKQIEDNSLGAETLPEEKLQDYAQRLNEIDPSIFKKVTVTEEEPYIPERERKVTSSTYPQDQTVGEFRNEYLDDFINEVREYNIKKGNRESENTQIDILNQLNAVSRAKRSDYIQNIEEDVKEVTVEPGQTGSLNRDEIAAQVKSLLMEEETQNAEPMIKEEPMLARFVEEPTVDVPPVAAAPVIERPIFAKPMEEPMPEPTASSLHTEEMKALMKQAEADTLQVQIPKTETLEEVAREANVPTKRHPFANRKPKPSAVPTKEEQEEIEREKRLQQKLVEETQQLRVQLNEYEDDLNDLSEGVEKTNKMLNIILGFLILALLVIFGIIVYWIVEAGGLV